MRPTFLGLEMSKSAAFTSQKSLDIVGNNLSNLSTNGYTRQRVDQSSVAPSAYNSRVASSRVGLAGMGVETLGVSQLRDNFLDKRFREEYSKSSYYGQASDVLSDIQSALGANDISNLSDVNEALSRIYTSIMDFQEPGTAPTDSRANLVLAAFKNMTEVMREVDGNLVKTAKLQAGDMQVNVDRVNEIFSQIDNLNKQISGDVTVIQNPDNEHYRPNELMDARNLLLDELAGYGNITTSTKADGKVTVTMGGHEVVSTDGYEKMLMTTNDDMTVSLNWRSSGETVGLSDGSLLSRQQYINGRGNNMQGGNETPQKGIPYYRDRLNTLASSFAKLVNNTIPEYGGVPDLEAAADANGNYPLKDDPTIMVDKEGNLVDVNGKVKYKTLVAAANANGNGTNNNVPITAANLAISNEWNDAGVGYFIYDRNSANFKYAQQLSVGLTEQDVKFTSYGESFTGTFEEYFQNVAISVGSDLSFMNGRQEASATVANDFLTRRDEISGVSRDEETANMIQYQKQFEAAARMMNTMDDLLEIIINRMGRVGL